MDNYCNNNGIVSCCISDCKQTLASRKRAREREREREREIVIGKSKFMMKMLAETITVYV